MQRALDGVLAALVATDLRGLLPAAFAVSRPDDVEILTDVQLNAEFVPDVPSRARGAAHQLIGVDKREVAHEDCDTLAVSA